eukprot:365023-Chlamydomonas_euryale.AAC.20
MAEAPGCEAVPAELYLSLALPSPPAVPLSVPPLLVLLLLLAVVLLPPLLLATAPVARASSASGAWLCAPSWALPCTAMQELPARSRHPPAPPPPPPLPRRSAKRGNPHRTCALPAKRASAECRLDRGGGAAAGRRPSSAWFGTALLGG